MSNRLAPNACGRWLPAALLQLLVECLLPALLHFMLTGLLAPLQASRNPFFQRVLLSPPPLPRRHRTFKSLQQLKQHLQQKHNLQFCGICLEGRKVGQGVGRISRVPAEKEDIIASWLSSAYAALITNCCLQHAPVMNPEAAPQVSLAEQCLYSELDWHTNAVIVKQISHG